MLPTLAVKPLAYGLPLVELALAVGIAGRFPPQFALMGFAGFLSSIFAGIHAYLIWSGTVVPYGCAGINITHASREMHVLLLAITLTMTVSAYVLLFLDTRSMPRAAAPAANLAGAQTASTVHRD